MKKLPIFQSQPQSQPQSPKELTQQRIKKRHWRSLEHAMDDPIVQKWIHDEFPHIDAELKGEANLTDPSRRHFLKVMGASMALLGLSACTRPVEKLVPRNTRIPEDVPGKPLYYASTLTIADVPTGVLVETHEGRPTKLEGLPQHPNSNGKLTLMGQAAILSLYDPDRARQCQSLGKTADWDKDIKPVLLKVRESAQKTGGAGLAIVRGSNASPSLARLERGLKRQFPKLRIYNSSLKASNHGASHQFNPIYNFDGLTRVLAIDSDFLGLGDHGTRYQGQFAAQRGEKPEDMRLYVAEPTWTTTGTAADHRLRIAAHDCEGFLIALASELNVHKELLKPHAAKFKASKLESQWIKHVAEDLKAHKSKAAVIVGRRQSALSHHLAMAINTELGLSAENCFEPPIKDNQSRSLVDLAGDLEASDNKVHSIVILGQDLCHNSPAELNLAQLIKAVPNSFYLGATIDHTAKQTQHFAPLAHELETWSDSIVAIDHETSCYSVSQSVINPIFEAAYSPLEVLAILSTGKNLTAHTIVQETFRNHCRPANFDKDWHKLLHKGTRTVRRKANSMAPQSINALLKTASPRSNRDEIELCINYDYSVFDGRYANNAWLQECPDPVTKLTWDNAALISPTLAKKTKIKTGDHILIQADNNKLEIPAFVLPGLAPNSIAISMGYGHKSGGQLAQMCGVNINTLQSADSPFLVNNISVTRGKGSTKLASSQEHWSLDDHEIVDEAIRDRAILRDVSAEQLAANPGLVQSMDLPSPDVGDLHTPANLGGTHQWGMVIDLNKCNGCNACVVGCQSENNIPVVGKDQVLLGREMHWMRIDRYFQGDDPEADVTVSNQPMLCQHCENAPCEIVCPVNATVHDQEGLNAMVYNRCIGTRYCSNNCPYKVRRFNFHDYNVSTLRQDNAEFDGNTAPNVRRGLTLPMAQQQPLSELEQLAKNPDVTVRMRGVMEKCTLCVQRIQRAKIDQKMAAGQGQLEPVRSDQLQTACQQTCPSNAIVFGNLNDPHSEVSQAHKSSRNYSVLHHLNTKPRITYLARVRNLNPKLPAPDTLKSNQPTPHSSHHTDHPKPETTRH